MQRRQLELQRIFDEVTTHLLQQRAKSLDGDIPRYRGPDGRMDGIGRLIISRVYDPDLEGLSIHHRFVKLALKESGIDTDNPNLVTLLEALQRMHDEFDVGAWPAILCGIAGRYGLDDSTVLDATPAQYEPE